MPDYPLPKLEELVFNAIVDRFFEPVVTFENRWSGTDSHGQAMYTQIPIANEAPVAGIAGTIYSKYHNEIAKAVFAKIDLKELGERVAASVVHGLTEKRGSAFEVESHEMKEIRKLAKERVAEELYRRMLAKLDEDES